MKGQLSAEMLILIAVVLAIVAIVAFQMLNTAEKGSEKIESQTDSILNSLDDSSKNSEGESCEDDSDCLSDNCSYGTCE